MYGILTMYHEEIVTYNYDQQTKLEYHFLFMISPLFLLATYPCAGFKAFCSLRGTSHVKRRSQRTTIGSFFIALPTLTSLSRHPGVRGTVTSPSYSVRTPHTTTK